MNEKGMLEWKKYKSLEELREMYGDKLEELLYDTLIQYSEELDKLKTETNAKIEVVVKDFINKLHNVMNDEGSDNNECKRNV